MRVVLTLCLILSLFIPSSVNLVINPVFIDGDWMLQREIVMAVNDVALEYPALRGTTVRFEAVVPGVYAFASEGLIVFNTLYLERDIFESTVHLDIALGFHPELGDCSPARMLAYHESAHLIDRSRDRVPRIQLLLTFGVGRGLELSGYSFAGGIVNPGEALAEAFAAVRCNGGNDHEQILHSILTT